MARKALVRSEAGRSWEASNASFAARAIDSVSPMRLSTQMTLSERSVGNSRVKMSGRGKNATDADAVETLSAVRRGLAKLGVARGFPMGI